MTARLLIIDDDDAIRDATAIVVRDAGFAVAEAANWLEAKAAFSMESVDAVVTDLQLPPMPDASVIALIRACAPGVPIIAVSGEPGLEGAAHALGAQAFLTKPAIPHLLLAEIRARLEARP